MVFGNMFKLLLRKRILVVLALSCLSAAALKADDYVRLKDDSSFRRELAAKTSEIRSVKANFVQTKYLSVFKSEVKSGGMFYWQSSGNVCLDYLTPVKYRMTITGDKLSTTAGGKTSVMNMGGNPVAEKMRQLISSCMTGNIDFSSSGFAVSVAESGKDFRISIEPERGETAGYVSRMEVHIARGTYEVRRLVIYENETDYTEYVFSGQKYNEEIPSSVFDMR